MEWFNLPLVIALVLLSALWLLLRRRRRQVVEAPAYRLESALLNDNELNFLQALEQALGDRHRVQCKVGLAAVVGLRPGLESRCWQQAADEICDRQFSFLVCLRDNLKPLCAIELDDSSHRPEPDPVLDRVCNDAGLPLLRFPAQRTYVPAEIGLRFDQLFAPAAGPDEPTSDEQAAGQATQGLLGPARPAEPECPECGAPMTKRQTRGDFQVEQDFWLCGLPECRKRIPLERNDQKRPSALDGLVP